MIRYELQRLAQHSIVAACIMLLPLALATKSPVLFGAIAATMVLGAVTMAVTSAAEAVVNTKKEN